MKKIFINISIFIFSIFIAFFIFEKFLIWENEYTLFKNPTVMNIKDINYEFYFHEEIDKSKNSFYFFGDSFTKGTRCVVERKDLVSDLEKKSNINNTQFVNLAENGKSLPNYIDLLHHFDLKKGDKVFLVLYDNDIIFNQEMCELSIRQNEEYGIFYPKICDKKIKNNLLNKKNETDDISYINLLNDHFNNFRTYRLFKEAIWQFKFLRKLLYRDGYQNLWIKFSSEENIYLRNAIKYISDFTSKNGSNFYLTYYPNTNFIHKGDQRHKIWLEFFNKIVMENSIKYYDPYPYFINNSKKKRMVGSLSDAHPSCDANLMMSNYFIEKTDIFKN